MNNISPSKPGKRIGRIDQDMRWPTADRTTSAAALVACVCLALGASAMGASGETGSEKDKVNYSIGYAFGAQLANLRRQGVGVELESVFRGALDALSGANPLLDAGEMRAMLANLARSAVGPAAQPLPEGAVAPNPFVVDFADLNAKREGVISLPSGVQYEVIKTGRGDPPQASGSVTLNYRGTLTNGVEFDSTESDGSPADLKIDQITVPGMKEALLLMQAGAKWRVYVPAKLGFTGNTMLRNKDLIYEIELVSIKKPETGQGTRSKEP